MLNIRIVLIMESKQHKAINQKRSQPFVQTFIIAFAVYKRIHINQDFLINCFITISIELTEKHMILITSLSSTLIHMSRVLHIC